MELSKFHGIPWNFPFDMEKFHGIPWNSMELLASSMEFHGIPWNCEILILINFIIGEVYFIVSCMISCHCISDNPLVVEILRYFNSKATFWCPSFWLNGGIDYSILNGGLFKGVFISNSKLRNFVIVAIECFFATIDRCSVMTGINRWSMMISGELAPNAGGSR